MTRIQTANAGRIRDSDKCAEAICHHFPQCHRHHVQCRRTRDAQGSAPSKRALTLGDAGAEHPEPHFHGACVTQGTDRNRSLQTVGYDGAMQLAEFDPQVLLSPSSATPASSEVSSGFYDNPGIYDSEQCVRYTPAESPSWNAFHDGQYPCKWLALRLDHVLTSEASPSQLVGICETASYDDAAICGQSYVDLVSPPEHISQTRQQRHSQAFEPWSEHAVCQEDSVGQSPSEDPILLDQNLEANGSAASPNSSCGEKGGRRVGPLTQQQRKKANAVRMKGACLRCAYMKETCDDSEDSCSNCKKKKGRKWKLGCVRKKLSEQIDFLLPAILRERYSRHTVSFCTNNNAWWYLDRHEFILKLDLDIPGSMLEVPVKEVEIIDPSQQDLHAWKTNTKGDVPFMEKTDVWSPPLVLYLTDKAEGKRRIFNQLSVCMNRVFSIEQDDPIIKPKQAHWPWPCFDSAASEWEAHIVIAIFEYWRKDLPSHKILGKAHTVLFFNYVLDHMWQVTAEGLTEMLRCLKNKQGYDPSKKISPDTVNCFLKSLVFEWTLDCIKDILKDLQDILHAMAQGKETSTATSDMAFCLSFMMLVTLSQIQSRLLLLTTYKKREIGITITPDQANRLIEEMEKEVATYIIHLHEFSLNRRKPPAAPPNPLDEAEKHAASFGLMDRVEELTQHRFSAYSDPSLHMLDAEFPLVDHKPSRFKLPSCDVDRFDPVNTHRLCWKFVDAIGNTTCA